MFLKLYDKRHIIKQHNLVASGRARLKRGYTSLNVSYLPRRKLIYLFLVSNSDQKTPNAQSLTSLTSLPILISLVEHCVTTATILAFRVVTSDN